MRRAEVPPPSAWIEDPALTPGTELLLEHHGGGMFEQGPGPPAPSVLTTCPSWSTSTRPDRTM
jgi:hypothetical protein